jgi:tripartite-type tricarboxylate transporter receptor subunit TctC
MTSRRHFLATATAGAAMLLGAGPAAAQSSAWPSQTIKLVVPFAPGGGGDVLGRLIGEKLAASIGRPVVVENKPGASTVVATESVVRAEPDGHTILLNVPLIVQTTALMAKLPYDPIRDLTPVTDVVTTSLWLAVNPQKIQAKNLKEFVAEVKAQPKTHSYGSIGQGSSTHLFGHALNDSAGLDMVHVPYKGSTPAVLAAGKVRLIAVTGAQRSGLTPEVPTFAEQGYPGFEMPTWAGLFVPSRTPKDVVAKLHGELVKIMQAPDVVARFAELGYLPGGQPQERFAAQVRDEKERWTTLIRKAGVTVQ